MRFVKKCVDWFFGLVAMSPFIGWAFSIRPFSSAAEVDYYLNFFDYLNDGAFDNFCESIPWFDDLNHFIGTTLGFPSVVSYVISWTFIVVMVWLICRVLLWFVFFVASVMDKVFDKGKGNV